MVSSGDPPPEEVLEDMVYLSRSETRLQVLTVLATSQRTPRDLSEVTDTPRSTLRRILTELVERGWADRTTDGEYVATRAGEEVAAETERYIGALQGIRTLDGAISWLPDDELTIGLQHFRSASLKRPEANAVLAPDTYLIGLLDGAAEFSCLVNTAPTVGLEKAMLRGVADGRLSTNHVITDDELAVLREDSGRVARWQEYIEAGADVFCYTGPIPGNLIVVDQTVLLADRDLETIEFVVSENETVRSWALETIERYRGEAQRLDAESFSEAQSMPAEDTS